MHASVYCSSLLDIGLPNVCHFARFSNQPIRPFTDHQATGTEGVLHEHICTHKYLILALSLNFNNIFVLCLNSVLKNSMFGKIKCLFTLLVPFLPIWVYADFTLNKYFLKFLLFGVVVGLEKGRLLILTLMYWLAKNIAIV